MPLLKKILERNIVYFLLAVGSISLLVNPERAFINRMNNLKTEVDSYLPYFERGTKNLREVDLNLASYYFKNLAQTGKTESLFYATKGFCDYHLRRYPQAVRAYETAFRLEPNIYTFSWDLGMIAFRFGRYEDAVGYLSHTLNVIPLTLNYYQMLAGEKKETAQRAARFPLTFQLEERAKSDEEEAVHFLALCFYKLGRFEKMVEVAKAGLKDHPRSALLVYDIGLGYFLMQQIKEAEIVLTQAIARNPQYLNAYIYRSQARDLLGNRSGSAEDKQKMKELKARGASKKDYFELHANADLIYLRYQAK